MKEIIKETYYDLKASSATLWDDRNLILLLWATNKLFWS